MVVATLTLDKISGLREIFSIALTLVFIATRSAETRPEEADVTGGLGR